MAVADGQRAGDAHTEHPNRGERRLSLTEGLVLCLVSEGPTYGLTLAGQLAPDASLGRIWSVPKGVVYYTLQRLELLGLIQMTPEQRAGSGRARSFCEITPAGRAAAEAWLRVPVDHIRDVRSELMVKLALHNRTGSDSRPLVRAQLARLAPAAAALEDRLGTASGFERTIVLWRHEAMTATMQFLTALAKRRRRAPARANRKGPPPPPESLISRGVTLISLRCEPGARARALLDQERVRLGLTPAELPGYGSQVSGHLQVAASVAGRLADAGVPSEPAGLANGLRFVPLAAERFDPAIPAKPAASRQVQGLLKVLRSPWLLTQLASLPGYKAAARALVTEPGLAEGGQTHQVYAGPFVNLDEDHQNVVT